VDYLAISLGFLLGFIGNFWGHYYTDREHHLDEFLGFSLLSIIFFLFSAIISTAASNNMEILISYVLGFNGTVITDLSINKNEIIRRKSKCFFTLAILPFVVLLLLLLIGIGTQYL
jgi:hypothetical protein